MLGLPFTPPPWALKALAAVVCVLAVLFAIRSWVGALKHEAVAEVNVAAEHQARGVEQKVATITTKSALKEASAQEREKEKTRVIVQKVPHYVVRATPCITWGFVRVLDAAARGVDPAAVELPAGQSDDACASVGPDDVARSVAENYGIARQNAEQLDALEADVRERIDAANGTEEPRQ